MRKFLNITMLLATALLLSITGCISESDLQPPTPINPDTEHTLQLRIVQSATTRGVNRPVQDNEPLALRTGDLYLVHQTGIISHHFRIVAADAGITYLTNTNREAGIIHRNLLDAGVSLPGIPGTVTSVVMVGNYHGTTALPTEDANVSAVGSRVLDIISQHDAQGNTLGVNLFGEDELTPLLHAGQPVLADDGSPVFSASIFLRPTVARFEIADITAAGNITAFTIDGIFLDGFYRHMAIDGTLANNATQFIAGVTPASFTNTTYGFDTNFAVHDWREAVGGRNWTGSAATSLTVQAGGTSTWHCSVANAPLTRNNVWGYQVFAQSHAHTRTVAPPNIVIRLSGIESSCGSEFPAPQFVTVGTLLRTVDGDRVPLTEILASRVYRIPAGGLVFDERDLSPLPNNLEMEVQIEILLDVWNPDEVVPYTPLRQSNPRPVSIYDDETHTFALGAAWGGGCIDPVVYLWEQSADGIDWEPAYGINNEAHYTTTYLLHDMYFRRSATRCGNTITSEPALVTVSPVFTQPNPVAVTICHGETHTFDLGAAMGGYGTITYQWQSSTDGTTWTDIAGATAQHLTTDALTATAYFRRQATAATRGGTINSSGALVTVAAALATPHPVAVDVALNHGTVHTFNLDAATGGIGAFSYQWQSSADGITFTDISGATGQNLTTALTANTYFRRVATNVCGYVVSNSASVAVNPLGIGAPTATTDPGVMVGGLRWATRSVGYPGTFASDINNAGRLYQWGTFGGVNHHWPNAGPVIGNGAIWNNQNVREAWTATNNPCPPGWRIPTLAEVNLPHPVRHTNLGIEFISDCGTESLWLPASFIRRAASGGAYMMYIPTTEAVHVSFWLFGQGGPFVPNPDLLSPDPNPPAGVADYFRLQRFLYLQDLWDMFYVWSIGTEAASWNNAMQVRCVAE